MSRLLDIKNGRTLYLTDLPVEGRNYTTKGRKLDLIQLDNPMMYYDILSRKQFYSLEFQEQVYSAQPLVYSNSATGTRKSIWRGQPDRGPGEVDSITIDGITYVSAMAAATNLVDTDVTNWADGGTAAVVTYMGDGVYRITFDGSGPVALNYYLAGGFLDRFGRCEARLISGTPAAPTTDYFGFRAGSSVFGTQYAFEDLTGDWQIADCFVTNANSTSRLSFRASNASPMVIEVRDVRGVDSTAPAAAFPDGSPAGTSYSADVITSPLAWGAQGLIYQNAIPYGWSGSGNPVNSQAYWFDEAPLELTVYNSENLIATDAIGAIISPPEATATLKTTAVDWNGTLLGFRNCETARSTDASTRLPTGTFTIGNNDTGLKPFHGILGTLPYDSLKSDAEYTALREGSAHHEAILQGLLQ